MTAKRGSSRKARTFQRWQNRSQWSMLATPAEREVHRRAVRSAGLRPLQSAGKAGISWHKSMSAESGAGVWLPHRVHIIGGLGSGKSTLARQLGVRLGAHVVELDQIAYRPGGVKRTLAERSAGVDDIVALPGFISEGTSGRSARVRPGYLRSPRCTAKPNRLAGRGWRLTTRRSRSEKV
jgi:hypothetical protein